jgi:hypothetical protein
MSLYPENGRVISANTGHATLTRDSLQEADRDILAVRGQQHAQPEMGVDVDESSMSSPVTPR